MKKILSYYPAILLLILSIFIVSCDGSDTLGSEQVNSKIQVGVFNGNGASPVCVIETLEALKIDGGILGCEISATEIQQGKLDELDVLIFPGGSGSKEYNNLGNVGELKVKEFVKGGKGVVGICAGGYLLTNTEGYPSLKMLKVSNYRDHYNRGRGLISFVVNDEGKKIFPELASVSTAYIQYYDGPIYRNENLDNINILGMITSNIATHEGDPIGVTEGKAAFLTQNYGDGKMFVSVGHPESTPGMRWIVPRMVRWVSKKELVSYSSDVVRPTIYNKEILYYADQIKYEKENFWSLMSDDQQNVIDAIDNLNSIRSRPSIRWSIGLLRHSSWEVRLAAANYLLETEYTFALKDFNAAVESEGDTENKQILIDLTKQLEHIYNSQESQ